MQKMLSPPVVVMGVLLVAFVGCLGWATGLIEWSAAVPPPLPSRSLLAPAPAPVPAVAPDPTRHIQQVCHEMYGARLGEEQACLKRWTTDLAAVQAAVRPAEPDGWPQPRTDVEKMVTDCHRASGIGPHDRVTADTFGEIGACVLRGLRSLEATRAATR